MLTFRSEIDLSATQASFFLVWNRNFPLDSDLLLKKLKKNFKKKNKLSKRLRERQIVWHWVSPQSGSHTIQAYFYSNIGPSMIGPVHSPLTTQQFKPIEFFSQLCLTHATYLPVWYARKLRRYYKTYRRKWCKWSTDNYFFNELWKQSLLANKLAI